jgi:prevent-host-death family protein
MRAWQAADAKQNFGRLVEAARREPQALMRHSEPVGVVMSMEHYRALKAQADAEFASFLLASPLEEGDFDRAAGMSLSDEG